MKRLTLSAVSLLVALKAALVATVFAIAGCSEMMNTPTTQSVAGLSPSGNVTITEDFVTGLSGGSGTLEYQGRTYPFKVVGTVAGPDGGLRKSARPARSISSPASPIFRQIRAKHRQGRLQLIRQQRFVGWRTAPA